MVSEFKYVPYHHLTGSSAREHIVIDGSAGEKTALLLSHWPGSNTPESLKADLSTEIVFNFIDSGMSIGSTDIVTNNHFDEDGLIGLYAMINREDALERRQFLIEVASAGDFSRCLDRDAARVAFVISAWTNPVRSPLSDAIFSGSSDDLSMILYEELLSRLPKIMDKIQSFEYIWSSDDYCLSLTEEAIASGRLEIEVDDQLDLAVISLPDEGIFPEYDESMDSAFGGSWTRSVCHPMAIHNTVDNNRILIMKGRRYELYFRYESWVEYQSRKIPPRVDLLDLTKSLSAREGRRASWQFNGTDALISRLSMNGGKESKLSPLEFVSLVSGALKLETAASRSVS